MAEASVVVPVRDRRESLRRLVGALRRQTFPRERFEVVVADDGSVDGSCDGIEEEGWLRVLPGPPVNSYAARNRGAAAARGAVLAFTDSDCVPEPGWLEAGLQAIAGADLVAGEIRHLVPPAPTIWTLLTVDGFLDQERSAGAGYAATANLFVCREVLESLGGFDDRLRSVADWEFVTRARAAGRRLVYAAQARVGHPTSDDARAFLGRTWRYNRGAVLVIVRGGGRPGAFGVGSVLLPLAMASQRRRTGSPLVGLRAGRLREAGLRPGPGRHALAVLALYGLAAPVAGAAHLAGWRAGRRMRIAAP